MSSQCSQHKDRGPIPSLLPRVRRENIRKRFTSSKSSAASGEVLALHYHLLGRISEDTMNCSSEKVSRPIICLLYVPYNFRFVLLFVYFIWCMSFNDSPEININLI